MLTVEVRSETGERIAATACGLKWSDALADLSELGFPMLGSLLPYADTIFNSRQLPVLLGELDRLPEKLQGPWVAEVRELGRVALEEPHRYLWFLGD
jgi:hypothetical protein